MNKQLIRFLIILLVITFSSCDIMATLFHGEKPEPPPVTFTVKFFANGASGTPPEELIVNSGTVINLPDKGTLSSEGNIFVGWNENPSGSSTTYSIGASITVKKNMVFYAQWLDGSTPQFTVAFNANGATGGSPPASQTVYSGISITIPNQGTLINSGKTFGGWNTQLDGSGTNYAVGAIYTVTGSITLYAKWEITYSLNPPANPTVVNVGDKELYVEWEAVNGATSYEVWIGTANDSSLARNLGIVTGTRAKIPELTNGVTYYIWVKAKNASGTSDFSTVAIGIPTDAVSSFTVNNSSTFASAIASINSSTKSGTYSITVTATFSCAPVSFTSNAAKTILLQGSGGDRILYNSGSSYFFSVPNGITFSLGNNITLNKNQKNYSVVRVLSGGKFNMEAGSIITGTGTDESVRVNGGTFTMNGGTISESTAGGVRVDNNGIFTLVSGTISGNNDDGVMVWNAIFNMLVWCKKHYST